MDNVFKCVQYWYRSSIGLIQNQWGVAAITTNCLCHVGESLHGPSASRCEFKPLLPGRVAQLWKGQHGGTQSLFHLHSLSVNSGMLQCKHSMTNKVLLPVGVFGLSAGLRDWPPQHDVGCVFPKVDSVETIHCMLPSCGPHCPANSTVPVRMSHFKVLPLDIEEFSTHFRALCLALGDVSTHFRALRLALETSLLTLEPKVPPMGVQVETSRSHPL